MSHPKVTVICIVANTGRFFSEAVDSVLSQDLEDFELLLVAAGARDGSTALALRQAMRCPARITCIEAKACAEGGLSAARNLGLAHARGEYIAFIDSADRWRPRKLREQVAIMDAHREVGMVAGTVNKWRSWLGGADQPVPTGHLVDAVAPAPEAALATDPLGKSPAPCLSDVMIRRSVLEQVGGFESRSLGAFDGHACLGKLMLAAPVYLSGRVWADQRRQDGGCPKAVRETHDPAERAAFLRWYCGYLKGCDAPRRKAVLLAARRAQWIGRLHPATWGQQLLPPALQEGHAVREVVISRPRSAPR